MSRGGEGHIPVYMHCERRMATRRWPAGSAATGRWSERKGGWALWREGSQRVSQARWRRTDGRTRALVLAKQFTPTAKHNDHNIHNNEVRPLIQRNKKKVQDKRGKNGNTRYRN